LRAVTGAMHRSAPSANAASQPARAANGRSRSPTSDHAAHSAPTSTRFGRASAPSPEAIPTASQRAGVGRSNAAIASAALSNASGTISASATSTLS
jgi:hypothetical protein